jgi:DNA-directed RNA polymerase II subunit RPB1
MSFSKIPYSELSSIEFSILGSEENETDANVYVTHSELYKQGIPYQGGIYDAHMGTTEHNIICKTCQNYKEFCPGHCGVLILNQPVISPFFIKEVMRWLRVLCFNCGKILMKYESDKLPMVNRINMLGQLAKNIKVSGTKKSCPHCSALHPLVTKDKGVDMTFWMEIEKEGKKEKYQLYPHQIETVFNKVTNETMDFIKKPPRCHPRRLVLRALRVPPNTIRPDIKRFAGGRSGNDDLTILLQSIVKCNEKLPHQFPDEVSKEFDRDLHVLQLTVYEFIKGSSATAKRRVGASAKHPMRSIAKRFPGKKGRVRGNMLGRRVNEMARSYITCYPGLPISVIMIPKKVAKIIQIPMFVREYNRELAMIYFMNGVQRYPGCTRIRKVLTGNVHWVENVTKDFTLEIGDILYRDMVDGDPIAFNRAPSLTPSEISCVRAKIVNEGDSFPMNVLLCNAFHADFDGDAMNVPPARSSVSQNEITLLSSLGERFITYQNSVPTFGEHQDSVIGTAELTKSRVVLDKQHLMQLFSNIEIFHDFSDILPTATVNGRNAITILLQEKGYLINYTGRATFYDSHHEPYVHYDPTDIKVSIEHGELKSGVLDKSSISQGVRGSIFHIIHNKYGAAAALDAAWYVQQLAIQFLLNAGLSIGLRDFIMKPEHLQEIHDIESKLIAESMLITEKLHDGKLIAPLGVSLKEYYEQMQIEALNPGDSYWPTILKSIDYDSNSLYKLIMHGSKGAQENFRNISTAIGQIEINGERIKENFGGRALSYFTRHDPDPGARGYISNSYKSGLTPPEFVFHSMESRFQIISKALSTSIPGDQNRKGIKNLESSIINNLRQIEKNGNISDLLYGDDGVDPRRIEDVKFPTMTIGINDVEFRAKYYTDAAKLPIKSKKGLKELFDAEYAHLVKDRNFYRELFLNREYNGGRQYKDSALVPVNIGRVIDDTIYQCRSETNPVLSPAESVKKVKELCKTITYGLMNEYCEKKRVKLPEYMLGSTKLLRILIRSYLNYAYMNSRHMSDTALDIVIIKIKGTYKQSLIAYGTAAGIIAAQALSEPMTQMIIDSHRTSGVSSTKKKGVFAIKETMGARDTAKMKSPSMVLHPLQQFEKNKEMVQSIANHIEALRLRQFVLTWKVFYESYGNPTHPEFIHEAKLIKNFEKYMIHIKPPSDLTKFCIRFTLDKIKLVEKQLKMETIFTAIKREFPFTYIVYTTDNVKDMILRIYFRNSAFKNADDPIEKIKEYVQDIMEVLIRGIPGIKSAYLKEENRTIISAAGAIQSEKSYYIFTVGSNLEKVLQNPFINKTNILTNSVLEVYRVYGISAARKKIIYELMDQLGDKVTYKHFTVYANEMTYTGNVTSIDRYGSAKRRSNLLLRISDASPLSVIEESALNGESDQLDGVSAPILMGKNPRIGDLYNSLKLDEQFVAEQMNTKKILDDI